MSTYGQENRDPILGLPLPATPRRITPRGVTGYANAHRGSAILLLFGLLILVRTLRHGGQLPDRREMTGYLLGAFFFVLTAAVVPDFAAALLLVLLIASAFGAAPQITAALNNVSALINDQATAAAGRLHGGP